MNWITTPSAWQEAQAWRARRQAAADDFQSQSDTVVSGLATALYGQIDGSVTNATQAAVTRIQAQAKAKVQKLTSSLNVTA